MATGMDYEVAVLRSAAEIEALEPEWNALSEHSDPRNPFLSYDWTRICLKHVCPGSSPYVMTVRREGGLVGVAPLRLDREAGFRVLRFVGDGRSDYLGVLHTADAAGVEDTVLTALERRRGEWDLAVLRHLADTYSRLHTRLVPRSLRACETEGTVAPHVTMDADWNTLLASGPGWLKRMAKASRKWAKEGGTVTRHCGPDSAGRVGQIADIEGRSWKGREGVGRFQPGRGQELLRDALGALPPRGEMEVWLAHMDGRPVAFEINFLTPDRIWLYQGAYDEEYRKFSPGGVLDFLSIQRAWEAGAREYDFLSGDEPYKAERTNATRSLRYLALYPTTLRGMLAFALLIAPRWRLKQFAFAHAAHQSWIRLRNRLAENGPATIAGAAIE